MRWHCVHDYMGIIACDFTVLVWAGNSSISFSKMIYFTRSQTFKSWSGIDVDIMAEKDMRTLWVNPLKELALIMMCLATRRQQYCVCAHYSWVKIASYYTVDASVVQPNHFLCVGHNFNIPDIVKYTQYALHILRVDILILSYPKQYPNKGSSLYLYFISKYFSAVAIESVSNKKALGS